MPSTLETECQKRDFVNRLIGAAADRTERVYPLDETESDWAIGLGGSVQAASRLYGTTLALQDLDLGLAVEELRAASELIPLIADRRLRWWYHLLEGELELARGSHSRSVAAFERAINLAQEPPVSEPELERSYSRLMRAHRHTGNGERVANTLLRYLRERSTTTLGPEFYSTVADELLWLGEADLAFTFRQQAMQVVRPTGGCLAGDQRALARSLIALGQNGLARDYLSRSKPFWKSATRAENVLNYSVATVLCVAENDLAGAEVEFASLCELATLRSASAEAAMALAECYVEHGRQPEADALLRRYALADIRPDLRWRYYEVAATSARRQGDTNMAVAYYDAATKLASVRLPSTESVARVRDELDPWLAVANVEIGAVPTVERHRAFRARWLTSTARDMRRSMAPALLAARSQATAETKRSALQSSVDELSMISEFLTDASPHHRCDADFWATLPVANRILGRRGATLVLAGDAGARTGGNRVGLAGRLAFGLVIVIADQGSGQPSITLTVSDDEFVIEASSISQETADRVISDLHQLRTRYPVPGMRVPPRASFLATLHAASTMGWTISVSHSETGILRVEVDTISTGTDPERKPVRPRPAVAAATAPSWRDHKLAERIVALHEHRFTRVEPDLELLEEARSAGDLSLLASALLVNVGACLFSTQRETANDLMTELDQLIADHPELLASLWPSRSMYANRQYGMSRLRGDTRAMWFAACSAVAYRPDIGSDSPAWRYDFYNLGRAELDRGAPQAAWRLAGLCDPMSNSTLGRCLELALQISVLSADGRHARAADISNDHVRLARGVDAHQLQQALVLNAVVLAKVGHFTQARAALRELQGGEALRYPGQAEAVRAFVAFHQGDSEEALAACAAARLASNDGLDNVSASITVPIEAELLMARGQAEAADAVLARMPVSAHRLLDLGHRLQIEEVVARALGDDHRRLHVAVQRLELALGRPRFGLVNSDVQDRVWQALRSTAIDDRDRIDAEQSAVASVVGHAVRNVLASIVLDAEMAEIKGEDASSRIELALHPIEALAAQLDAVARLGKAAPSTETPSAEFGDLLWLVQQPIRALYERTGGKWCYTSELPVGVVAVAETAPLEIVLRNLLANAVRHGHRSGVVQIEVRVDDHGPHRSPQIVVTIDDDGPQVPGEELQCLQHAVVGTADGEIGTTLGLWIAKRYSAELGFDLAVGHSKLGGTRVEIRLPALASPDVGMDEPVGFEMPPKQPSAPAGRVLVVEDDVVLSELIVGALREEGYDVRSAETADQALRIASVIKPDMVLSDIELADGSTGYDVLSGLRARSMHPAFILMSGQGRQQIVSESVRRFGHEIEILAKPFSMDALFGTVTKNQMASAVGSFDSLSN